MTTSRTSAKRTKAGASRSRTGRTSGSSTATTKGKSRKASPSSSTSRKTTSTSKQAAAKTASAKKATAKPATARAGASRAAVTATDTVDMVRDLAGVIEAHGLSEVIIDLPNATLTLRRNAGGAALAPAGAGEVAPPAPVVVAPQAPAQSPAPQTAAASEAPKPDAKPTGHLVTSPFVGTFYRSPNPDSPPYVDVGTRVEKGQPLCIVEAMKLMNEIEADQSGVIAAVLVENAEPVEYGQPLFEIAPG